jgi:oligosaccharide repeat unit polymerase
MFKVFQPFFIFCMVWLIVILLFNLRLSNLLTGEISEAYKFFFIASGFFLMGYIWPFILYKKINFSSAIFKPHNEKYEELLFKYFHFWIAISIIEIIYSGGIPIVWLFTGSGKTYAEFGIPSIHGLMNALELVLGLISYYFYRLTKKKKFLLLTITFVVWNLCIITRQVIVVLLLEIFFIYYYLAKNKWRLSINLIISFILFVVFFGIVGDLRTGADNFVQLAQPSDNWIDWLPSGFLWVYIYVTTPLNNLLYNFTTPIINYQFLFPNTLSLLFPSVIRNILYPADSTSITGDLVTQAFNVSSAFVAPYQDMGYYGICLFSLFAGTFTNVVWWRNGIVRIFFRAIIVQILILSIFFNHFFYLPVVFQFIWVLVFFRNFNNEEISEFTIS